MDVRPALIEMPERVNQRPLPEVVRLLGPALLRGRDLLRAGLLVRERHLPLSAPPLRTRRRRVVANVPRDGSF